MTDVAKPLPASARSTGDETVATIVRGAAAMLRAAGVDTPEHDAKLLCAEAFGVDLQSVNKAMLLGDGLLGLAEDPVKPLEAFHAMIDRRARREPLQHITGHAPFRYLDLKVGPGVFIPRPETELIVQEGIDWITCNGGYHARVVDLCAGSGAIGLAVVTEVPGSEVWAVEKSERTAEWTRRNLNETARAHPSIIGNYHLEIGDATQMPTLHQLDGTIDIVLTNPPYVPLSEIPEQPEVRDYDPDMALYGGSADGTLIPERIILRAGKLLRPGGLLVMEHDISQGERLAAYANAHGFANTRVRNDYTGRPRYLISGKS